MEKPNLEKILTNEKNGLSKQREIISEAVTKILIALGENPEREGLKKTPLRVAKAFEELLDGYSQDIVDLVNDALFEVDYGTGEMVLVQDIPYDSLCEHHMLPFSGVAHVAYIPSNKVIGLSKIPRIVEMYARRLQIQERLCNQVLNTIEEVLSPLGVMVMVEGSHDCAAMRGVKKKNLNMKTLAVSGIFETDLNKKDEFFKMLKQ
ncbi:MAG: GTP cyclohydrolase I FolE [Asgard group archaeon]|jgi:GTP cyclohydrolase I|nr:GTP cyclohydrolase I FolE [Candidatus Heimdallarchaeota archaeon]MEC8704123.1 GTP cyclohydrolase I FolE [Asgard group archaeon]|tara:strand:+ start:439 stop:1056 length:618 start_codon:yes stop_codon:yes gene_type:complete